MTDLSSLLHQLYPNDLAISSAEYPNAWTSNEIPEFDRSTHTLFTASGRSIQERRSPETLPTASSQHRGNSPSMNGETQHRVGESGTTRPSGLHPFQPPPLLHSPTAGYNIPQHEVDYTGAWTLSQMGTGGTLDENRLAHEVNATVSDSENINPLLSTHGNPDTVPESRAAVTPDYTRQPARYPIILPAPARDQTHQPAPDHNPESPSAGFTPATPSIGEGTPPQPGQEWCNECSRWLTNLRKHFIRAHRPKRHACNDCKMAFSERRDRDRHVSSIHLGKKDHKCVTCEKEFSRPDNLNRHIKQQHPN